MGSSCVASGEGDTSVVFAGVWCQADCSRTRTVVLERGLPDQDT